MGDAQDDWVGAGASRKPVRLSAEYCCRLAGRYGLSRRAGIVTDRFASVQEKTKEEE